MLRGGLQRWLLSEQASSKQPGEQHGEPQSEQTHSWWQVMCLTGVDYFSSLGYQPSIAIGAAGALSPIATLILVLFTLFGVLPMYRIWPESARTDRAVSACSRSCSPSGPASC